MSDLKTKPTAIKPAEFIKGVEPKGRRLECTALSKLMREATGKRATMWGATIIGFGSYHYRYESGREGDFFLTGFSPRKRNLTIYVMPGFSNYGEQLKALGRHTTGRSCLYLRALDDIDLEVLRFIVVDSVEYMKANYACR